LLVNFSEADHGLAMAEFGLGHAVKNDAQPCAQPDGPARGFNLAGLGAARRLA